MMKFTLDSAPGTRFVSAYEPGVITIGGAEYRHGVLLGSDLLSAWPVDSIAALELADLAPLLEQQPDILVLGSGTTQGFAPLALQAALSARRIGLETMNTAAACRTYNVLLSEDRRVAAALVV